MNYLTKKELLEQIQQLQFVVIELNLFLDTHPDNTTALRDYNTTVTKLKRVQNLYNRHYGMLTPINISRNGWDWVESPWPWERNYEEV